MDPVFVEGYSSWLSVDGSPRLDKLSRVGVNVGLVESFCAISHGEWVEVQMASRQTFYVPVPYAAFVRKLRVLN